MTTTRFALIALALATPALPASAETVPMTQVRVADLDLSSADGRATLDRRIARAARTVCNMGDERMLYIQLAERACQTAAIDGAMERVAMLPARATTQIALARPAQIAPRAN